MIRRLFISYARVDKWNVSQLVETLRAGGYEPWYDEGLHAGQDWKAQLYRAIEQSDALVYAMTPEAVNSEWCQWEVRQAALLGKPVIPVRLRASLNLSGKLRQIQFVDFTEGPTPRAVAKLMEALRIATPVNPGEIPDAPEEPRGVPVQVRETDERLTSTDEQPTVDDRIEQLNDVIDTVCRAQGLEAFFANRRPAGLPMFRERWNEIFASKICLFDLTVNEPDTMIELGVALALNKPILALVQQGKPIPDLIKNYRVIAYHAYEDLETQLRQVIEHEDFGKVMAIRSYCHFCSELFCRAHRAEIDPKKYLVISDNRLLWRPVLKQVEQQVVTRNAAFPQYSPDVGRQLCDLRSAVRQAQFVVAHLDYIAQDYNYVMLGIALGNATPWFLISQQHNIPPILRSLDISEYEADGSRLSSLLSNLDSFLKIVYPPPVSEVTAPMMTSKAADWQDLESLKGSMPGRSTASTDPILGEIEIIRYRGAEIESTHYLHPRTHNLVFGRKNEKGIVPLRSSDASNTHFRIYRENDRYYIEDLESKNGTFVNGQRLRPKTPTEIYFRNTITAGGSHFLIWDERPHQSIGQMTGRTKTLDHQLIPIELDVELPPDLETLHHEIILNAIYITGDNSEGTCSFEVQAYYPIGKVLQVLIRALNLPAPRYYLLQGNLPVNEEETPLSLGLKHGATLSIVPDRIEWVMVEIRKHIVECQNDTIQETDKNTNLKITKWKDEYTYVTVQDLFNEVYTRLFKAPPKSDVLIPTVTCPRCRSVLKFDEKVALPKVTKKRAGS